MDERPFFTTDELKSMSFKELAERMMFIRAKGKKKEAEQILKTDFNIKLRLEYFKIHASATEYHTKMRECMAAFALDDALDEC